MRTRLPAMVGCLLLLPVCSLCWQGATQSGSASLTNQDVLGLLKTGLAPEVVIAKIKSSACNFDTSPTALQELKTGGVPDAVILAMVQAPVGMPRAPDAPTPATPTAKSPAPTPQTTSSDGKIRVYVTGSQSWQVTGAWGASGATVSGVARPQPLEVIKTFGERCPEITVTNDKDEANYAVILDHEAVQSTLSAALKHRNKVAVFNRDGDAIFSDSTRSLGNAVKGACAAIKKDQASERK